MNYQIGGTIRGREGRGGEGVREGEGGRGGRYVFVCTTEIVRRNDVRQSLTLPERCVRRSPLIFIFARVSAWRRQRRAYGRYAARRRRSNKLSKKFGN